MLSHDTGYGEPALVAIYPPARVRTLGDVRDRLSQLTGNGLREAKLQISAINTVARASGCAPEDLSADPAALRQHLATISPAMAGLTRGSWSSVRSRILKALQRAEIEVMAGRRTKPLSCEWRRLYDALRANGKKAALSRFIGYLSDRSVSPGEVSDAHVERFRHELNTTSIRGNPQSIVRGAIREWNFAAAWVPGWPHQLLTEVEIKREGYVLPAERFTTSFQGSLSAYLEFLRNPPEDDDAPFRGLRPSTLALREFQFRQMASALVHRGIPIEAITSLGSLATRESVNTICEFFIERSGRPDCVQLNAFLRVLGPIARFHLKDAVLADWISRRAKRLSGGQGRRVGMTEKNRRRLAVFRDPQQVRQLMLLPFRLLKRARSGILPPAHAARLVRAAVAIELEIMCPIRLTNLAQLDIDRHFVRAHRGRAAAAHLFIPGSQTKNGEDIELELPRPTMDVVDLYVAEYRNLLISPESRGRKPRILFPMTDGQAKAGRVLADSICRILQRELGITFNMHLFRHLGCYLYLRAHPGQIDVMRRVLGHRDATTTMRFYAFIEQSDAFRIFDQHVLQIRKEMLRPSRGGPSSRRGAGR